MPKRVPSYTPQRIGKAEPRQRAEFDLVGNTPFAVTKRWRKFRASYLRAHPLCADCESAGIVVIATDVHHVIKRSDRPDLAFEAANCRALCHSCHSIRTGRGE
jgi:5-methylcytosine-specific restriction enzyme A